MRTTHSNTTRDFNNYKPFRTAKLKAEAQEEAASNIVNGTFRAPKTPVKFHTNPREKMKKRSEREIDLTGTPYEVCRRACVSARSQYMKSRTASDPHIASCEHYVQTFGTGQIISQLVASGLMRQPNGASTAFINVSDL